MNSGFAFINWILNLPIHLNTIVPDSICLFNGGESNFKVRRLHKQFLARFWGRGKQQTSYIVIRRASHISKTVYERQRLFPPQRP